MEPQEFKGQLGPQEQREALDLVAVPVPQDLLAPLEHEGPVEYKGTQVVQAILVHRAPKDQGEIQGQPETLEHQVAPVLLVLLVHRVLAVMQVAPAPQEWLDQVELLVWRAGLGLLGNPDQLVLQVPQAIKDQRVALGCKDNRVLQGLLVLLEPQVRREMLVPLAIQVQRVKLV